jgi:hypothetical protein
MSQTHDTPHELSRIVRDIRWLKAYGVVVTVALVAVGVLAAKASRPDSVLNAERINIVDRSGVTRLVIASSDRFPLPRLDGKEYPRAVEPAGMVFYDAKGNELGGMAITDAKGTRMAALAFDYRNHDAIGLFTREGADGKSATTGIQINSRPPEGLDVVEASKVVQRRIAIQNDDENAEILRTDPHGKDRIRLRVEAGGDAFIEVLDAIGNVTFRAPSASKD